MDRAARLTDTTVRGMEAPYQLGESTLPSCFKFTDRATGEVISLKVLDALICKEAGLRDDPQQWSYLYTGITMAGFAIVARFETCTDETFNRFREGCPDAFNDDRKWEIARKFLVTDFAYEAWYQPR